MDDFARTRLRPLGVGLLLSLLAIGFGWGMGGAFGAAEAEVKASLQARADDAPEAYKGDLIRQRKVVSKAWSYMKRAHLHAGVLGASSVALILLLAMLGAPGRLEQATSAMLGLGSLGYGLLWMLAGLKGPSMGSTHAAKASLEWLAVPSAGMLLVGLALVIGLTARAMYGPAR